ncbi:MAG: multicopper polyphenol oxidase, partial [Aeromicrobium sp.]|nr:multicopper polyphenol oxidase [Aeromicrobium sp.]
CTPPAKRRGRRTPHPTAVPAGPCKVRGSVTWPGVTTDVPLRRFTTAPPGVDVAVTTRHGGVSEGPYATLNLGDHVGDDAEAVRENRRLAWAAFGGTSLTIPDQQHRATVALIDEGLLGAGFEGLADARARLPGVDAMVTARRDATLCILVADCVPVVLWDEVAVALGVAHCGRGGVVTGVLDETIRAMTANWGTRPADLWVGLGPHIGASSYEVGPTEVAQTEAALPGIGVVQPTADGRGCVDLELAIRAQLAAAGVPADRVEAMPGDTRRRTDELFSDRAVRPCGRFGLLARIAP